MMHDALISDYAYCRCMNKMYSNKLRTFVILDFNISTILGPTRLHVCQWREERLSREKRRRSLMQMLIHREVSHVHVWNLPAITLAALLHWHSEGCTADDSSIHLLNGTTYARMHNTSISSYLCIPVLQHTLQTNPRQRNSIGYCKTSLLKF